jgi:NitT/TauT family transport system permease protein
MQANKTAFYIKGCLGFFGLLLIWLGLSYNQLIDPVFLPTPRKVIGTLFDLFSQRNFMNDIIVTTLRVIVGFSLGALFAIPLGIAMANWKLTNEVLRPFIAFFRYIPVSGFIPLLILWTGIGFTQKVLVIFFGIFFHLTILVADDASRTPREILDTAKILSASKLTLAIRVRLPFSLPAIFDDMRIMLGAAWTYIVLAELVAATSGIGNMMIESQRFLLTDRVIAGLFTVGIIGIVSDVLFRMIGKLVMPWTRVTEQHD